MRYGSKGDSATMPLGSKVPSALRPSQADEALISVGRCVKVTEHKDRLSGSDLVTVVGGVAVAQLRPQSAKPGPALRIVPAEVSLPGLPAQAQRLSRIESIIPPAPAQQDRGAGRRETSPQLAVPVYRPSLAPAPANQLSAGHGRQSSPSPDVPARRSIAIGEPAPSYSGLAMTTPGVAAPARRPSVAATPPSVAAPSRPSVMGTPPSVAAPSRPSVAVTSLQPTAQPPSAPPPSAGAARATLPATPRSVHDVSHVSRPHPPTSQAEPAAPAPSQRQPAPLPAAPDEQAALPTQESAASPAAAPAAPAEQPERPAVPPAPPAPEPGRDLFRRAAVEAHAVGARVTDTEDPKQGAWGMLILLLSLVAAIFCGAALLSVEVTVRAPGALRAPNGLRSVESVISGAVTQVLVRAGDEVAANQVVARLEETQLRATLTLRERELETLKRDTAAAADADSALFMQTTEAVLRQRAALGRRSSIHQTQMRQRAAQLSNVRELRRHGVATGNDELSGEEQVQAAAESIAVVGSQLAELNLALADRQREWKQRELDRRAALARATAAVDEAKSLLAMAEIRSPAAGRVESLLVHPGAVVQPGEVLAQIVPADAPRMIVAFLPSREMSFVSVGSEANVEVESLPVNEFGMARAKVSRISSDIAKPEEMEKAFGEALPGSYVRVELTLLEDGGEEKMAPHLRSGERVLVRLHRRQQRVLSMIFEFARKWLDS